LKPPNQKDRISRRGFLELGSAALATAGILGDAKAVDAAPMGEHAVDTPQPESAQAAGKIALEEHFALAETIDTSYAKQDLPTPECRQQILDVGSGRIAEMDRG
jgi:hypothetical protein